MLTTTFNKIPSMDTLYIVSSRGPIYGVRDVEGLSNMV